MRGGGVAGWCDVAAQSVDSVVEEIWRRETTVIAERGRRGRYGLVLANSRVCTPQRSTRGPLGGFMQGGLVHKHARTYSSKHLI